MALTLQQINEIRARSGELPLTELPATPINVGRPTNSGTAPINGSVAPQATPNAAIPLAAQPPATPQPTKTQEQIDAEIKKQEDARIQTEMAEAKRKEEELTAQQKKELEKIEKQKKEKEIPQPVEAELDDDKVMEYLQKKKGLKLKSFEELNPKPTPEDEAKAAEQRESDKYAWGLKSKKFKVKELQDFIADSKDPKTIVFNQYLAEAQKADPELKAEDVLIEFNERFGVEANEDTREFKRGQKELNLIADNLLRSQYGHIMGLESEYSKHEAAQNQEQSTQARILANAPAYKQEVEKVFSTLATKTVKIGDESYDIPVPQDFIERAKEKLLSQNFATPRIANGWDSEELTEVSRTLVDMENQQYFMQKAAEAYHEKHLKGVRGIVPASNAINRTPEDTLTDKQRKAAERHGAIVATPQAN